MRTLLAPALPFLLAMTADAQHPGVTQVPDSVVQRIDRAFAPIGGASAPGCAIGFARDARVQLTRAYGLANLEDGAPNTPETIFESGSVAKQFTAAAVLLLVQDGRLALDDDIRKYLPEMHDFGKRITIRNLLTHTSGLRDWYGLAELEEKPAGFHVHSPASILEIAARQRTLNFEPGAEYLYSNTGYILASVIVQRVSGKPFAEFSRERLFGPLHMTHTEWRDDFRKVVKGRAMAYTGNARAGYTLDMPFTNVIGSGGLLTTIGDWLTWNAFLDNPSALPGGSALVKSLTTPMTLNSGKQITYALGVVVSTREGMREVAHNGSTGGYRTFLGRYPDEHASIAVMCNAGDGANPTALAQTSLLALLGRTVTARSTPAFVHVAPDALKQYAGAFVGPTPEAFAIVAVRDTSLVVVGTPPRLMSALGPHTFRLGSADLTFEMSGSRVKRVLQISAAGDTTVFTPTRVNAPSRTDLKKYTGTYTSNELRARIEVVQRDSVLVLRQSPSDSLVLHPTVRDAFTSSGGTVEFTRDRSGSATSLGIWSGRVRNLRFTRTR